jgi:general secretion pathway protein I
LCHVARYEISNKNAGFTIIEVLIAIAVVAISLTAIGTLTGTTTRGVRSLEQHVALVETARTVAASLSSRTQLAPGELAGELYGNHWRIGVSPFVGDAITPAPDTPWIPETITIRIQSPSGAILGLETVRLQRRHE